MDPKPTNWIIYCHTHIESGRRYVGLTKRTMMFRWNQHIRNAKKKEGKGCRHFWNAIRKYGKDAFSHRVLEICTSLEVANAAEEAWIDSFSTRDPEFGFNLAKGGLHVPHSIQVDYSDPVVKAKRSAASLKMWKNPHVANQIALSIKKKWQDPNYKIMMSSISREVHLRPGVKDKLSKLASIQPKTSRFRGVCWNRQLCQWRAFLRAHGKIHNLGHFKEEILAAQAYDAKAREFFESQAKLNFLD